MVVFIFWSKIDASAPALMLIFHTEEAVEERREWSSPLDTHRANCLALLLTFFCPELNHMATPGCKRA